MIEISFQTIPRIQQDIDLLTAKMCAAYSGWANALTGELHDARYYERILIRVLIKLVPVVYTNAQSGIEAYAKQPDTVLDGQLHQCVGLRQSDFLDRIMQSDEYHACLRGMISLRREGRPLPRIPSGASPDAQPATALATGTVGAFGQKLRRLGCRTLLYKVPVTRSDQLRLALRSFGMVNNWYHPDIEFSVPGADPTLRATLRDYFAAVPTETLPSHLRDTARVMLDLLAYLLPVENVEHLAAYMGWARTEADRFRPGTLVTGYGFFDIGAFPFYAAECGARGTRLIGWQHGGTYGELATPGRLERWERRITDRYLTWGWSDGDPKLIATACPRQHLYLRKHKAREVPTKVLWVSTSDSRFNHFIDHTPVGNRLKDYFQHQDAILARLSPDIIARLVIRSGQKDFGWGLKDMWSRRLDTPTFSREGSHILDEADRCGLVLIDYPGSTTFLECLAAGIPFICVFDPAVYEIRANQAAAFHALEKAGILHTTPETAAFEIAEAVDDLEAWQAKPARRKALSIMCALVMRRDPDYLRNWYRHIA